MIQRLDIEMVVEFSPEFRKKYRKADVRTKHRVDECLRIFRNRPKDPELDNHALKREWEGFRSIDITSDWRAIYEYKQAGEEIIAYFVALGTHKELYETRIRQN